MHHDLTNLNADPKILLNQIRRALSPKLSKLNLDSKEIEQLSLSIISDLLGKSEELDNRILTEEKGIQRKLSADQTLPSGHDDMECL